MIKRALTTGLLVGTLDGLAACMNTMLRGGDPVRVFNFIASGVFGREAFSGGAEMAVWGVVFHFLIAIAWTGLYFMLYPRITRAPGNTWTRAALYGLAVWLVMNLAVLPLSNTPALKMNMEGVTIGILILIVCVGFPIAYSAERYARRTSP